MTTITPPPPVFAGIGPDHRFASTLTELRSMLADVNLSAADVISSEIKGRRNPEGWQLERFYCSVQSRCGEPGRSFAASTLYWTARAGRAEWFHFPTEPYLGQAAAWLHPRGHRARGYDVLRYVPLRRLTVRTGHRRRAIVKFKRRSRLLPSWSRVTAVAAAAAGSTVSIPALVGMDPQTSSYTQLAVDGPSMDQVVDARLVGSLLGQAGRVHAEFHALDGRDLPLQDSAAAPDAIGFDADWLAAQRPEYTAALSRVRAGLLARVPNRAVAATCHGDLIPSHLIRGEKGWTVIDLDLAERGDPHRDVAIFLAGLPADLARPELVEEAERAYLAGYAETSRVPLDPRTLAWHRAAADLHQLAVAAAKDRLPAEALRHGMDRLIDGLPLGSAR